MALLSSGLTDIGMKRKSNQDSIYLNRKKKFFVVADGMGGHKGGDIASALAVKHAPEALYKEFETKTPVKEAISNAINFANSEIFKTSENEPTLEGMGTTVVSLYFSGSSVYIGNVGDSRAYLVNNKKLYQMTKDHSVIQDLLSSGIYTRDAAAKDPRKNFISRTVGFEGNVEVDLFTYDVSRNDILFICSDGLHGKVSDEDITFLINKYIPDPAKATQESLDLAVKSMIQQANDNGGNDNISLIIVVAQ